MAKLHDILRGGGYTGHDLERLLVRILFCLFAEDTGIFELGVFALYREPHSARWVRPWSASGSSLSSVG